ncbi:MAG: hypothetical protein EBT07_01485 [Actinobacteria bacterium]|jgi:hypothetical protein|nr:hypothetical protein [Actinomycetota bacterium]
MNRPDAFSRVAEPVSIEGSATSYFSEPEEGLDPQLFTGHSLKGWVRNDILRLLFDFLNERYRHPDLWCHVWIAGSGVSFQWSAQRSPGDLDVLIGVDYIQFRKAHPNYMGLSDTEISKMLNEEFREQLQPETSNWNGYEVTFYVNPGATDIRSINPYAAYDLTHDEWTVFPKHQSAPHNAVWENAAQRDRSMALDIVGRYSQAMTEVHAAQNDAARRNAEYKLQQTLIQGTALFDDIHQARRLAFSSSGGGYSDFHNYRWQAGKKLGTVPALRTIHDYYTAARETQAKETYGIDLPDTRTLIRRAATYRSNG